MICSGCGNASAYRLSFSSVGESCDACKPTTRSFTFSDVYFKEPYFDPHIADPEKSPYGNYIKSREHKAMLMRSLGLSETGDKRHGSRARF